MINSSSYRRPWYLVNGHLESIIPYKAYNIYEVDYERERLELDDGDFIDIDWVNRSADQLIVITHALEGNSRDYFVERAAKYFSGKGYAIMMWHFRSCSKEMNRLLRFYHTGDTADLDEVIGHALHSRGYRNVSLLGFSMGGTTVINYLGSNVKNKTRIDRAAVFSTPLDLQETSKRLFEGVNRMYGRSFLKKWKRKIVRKAAQYPDAFDLTKLRSARTLDELHETFTVRLHGYRSIEEYYDKNSSKHFLPKTNTPLLLVNAENDPLLGTNSFPKLEPITDHLKVEYTRTGGHLGFSIVGQPHSWMELRAAQFFLSGQ